MKAGPKDDDTPRFLRRSTAADVPVPALLMTTALSQAVLVVTMFSDGAFDFAPDLTSSLSLIPFLLYAAGLEFVLVSFILCAPATPLFVKARREQNRRLFSPAEGVIRAVSVIGAVAGVTALAAGRIEL